MPHKRGQNPLTPPVDTGFEDVLAGSAVYEHEENSAPDLITIVTAPPRVPHVCVNAAGGDRCDICFGPVTVTVIPEPAAPAPPEPLPAPGLTDAGVQAAKALVHLPPLSYPDLAKLAREIAMDIKERSSVLREFNLNDTQYEFLETHNEFYGAALKAACKDWHAPLSTTERIKVEAAAILEDSLLGLGARMQNKSEGLPGVIEAAKLFAKVAGVGEREVGGLPPGERFVINIDLGGDQKITVESTPAPPGNPHDALQRALSSD